MRRTSNYEVMRASAFGGTLHAMKHLRRIILLVLILFLLVVAGGSGYRYLGGAHSLDVVGEATMHDGDLNVPGPGWSSYGLSLIHI